MGRTPLHYAGGHHDAGYMYELLKTAGADETIKDIVSYYIHVRETMLIW